MTQQDALVAQVLEEISKALPKDGFDPEKFGKNLKKRIAQLRGEPPKVAQRGVTPGTGLASNGRGGR